MSSTSEIYRLLARVNTAEAALAALDDERGDDKGRESRTRRERKRGSFSWRPGVEPIATARLADDLDEEEDEEEEEGTGPAADFHRKVSAIMRREGCARFEAVQRVCRKHPSLREEFVMAHNARHGRR